MSSNSNLPTIQVHILNKFLKATNKKGTTPGHLISVRALYGQALQFSVLLNNGALFTGLPANAILFKKEEKTHPIQTSQMYDCISDDIEVFTMEALRYAECTVKDNENKIHKAIYLFSIDFVGKSGLSYHPEQWKTFHCLKSEDDVLLIYPQYRIKFLDKGLCEKHNKKLPKYIANKNQWIIGS